MYKRYTVRIIPRSKTIYPRPKGKNEDRYDMDTCRPTACKFVLDPLHLVSMSLPPTSNASTWSGWPMSPMN